MKLLIFLLSLLVWPQAFAASLHLSIEIPKIDSREYHRPYVAVWIENTERQPVAQISHWLQKPKWHRDLKMWWRKGGRNLALPVDGVTGATRKPGVYRIETGLDLAQGEYTLMVEAAREVGGRELVRLPLIITDTAWQAEATGQNELGAIRLSLH